MDAATSRDILFSVRPKYASKIIEGTKTVELRRRFRENAVSGALALIYSSSPVRAVVGCARIKYVSRLSIAQIWKQYGGAACITRDDLYAYFSGLKFGFAIILESVQPLARQLDAGELRVQFGIVPPQSYRYVSGDVAAFLNDEQIQASDRHPRGDWPRRRQARSGVPRRTRQTKQ
jgi:predicted transcriptional regulator